MNNTPFDFNQFQKLANRTAKPLSFKENLIHTALGVAGEAGEFVDCIKKHTIYGKELDAANAAEELGDMLWFIALGCETLGITMEDAAKSCITKLEKRYPDKYSDFHAGARLDKLEEGQP